MPKGWNDLLDPKFKGLITMPNPVASGTGFLQIASILQMYGAKEGKEDGWEFLKKLDKNIGPVHQERFPSGQDDRRGRICRGGLL